nr:hypothetical protein [Deltaproteobacteria bacterium]
MNRNVSIVFVLAISGGGCKGRDSRDGSRDGYESTSIMSTSIELATTENESGGTGAAMALEEGKMGRKDSDRHEGQNKLKSEPPSPPKGDAWDGAADKSPDPGATNFGTIGQGTGTGFGYGAGGGKGGPRGGAAGPKGSGASETATRAWFPETFLFE